MGEQRATAGLREGADQPGYLRPVPPLTSPNAALPDRLTAEEARTLDRFAAEELGLPTLLLMENAAVNLAGVVLDLLEDAVELDADRFRVGVLCGGGNNGGDGWALCRHLLGFGVEATAFAARDPTGLTGDTGINARAALACGVEAVRCADQGSAEAAAEQLRRQHVLVDALLGTGTRGAPRAGVAGVIRVLNGLSASGGPPVLSMDLPSGLDADSGEPAEPTVQAGVTATFVAPKAGFSHPAAAAFLGRVVVCGIGVPDGVLARALR